MRRRVLLGVLLVAISIGLLQSSAIAVGLCGVAYTFKTPTDSVTSDRLNSNFVQASTTNSVPSCIQSESSSLTQMNTTVDPFPSGAASLATTLEGELQRIRFVLTRMHGATNWYTETQFSLGAGAGRLTIVSATSIQFCPFNGNMFRIPSTAKTYQIPSGCWTAANTSVYINGVASTVLAPGNLAASTTYFVYLFDLSGTPTVDFNTGVAHCADLLTGIEVRGTCAGTDNTRVLIGMVRTNASSQFQDDVGFRGVLSYFNRRRLALKALLTSASTTSLTLVEVSSTTGRINFVTWADSSVYLGLAGNASNAMAANGMLSSIGLDGTGSTESISVSGQNATAGGPTNAGLGFWATVSEGYHFATLTGNATTGGTATWPTNFAVVGSVSG